MAALSREVRIDTQNSEQAQLIEELLRRKRVVVNAGPGQAAVQIMPDGEIRVILGEGSQLVTPTPNQAPVFFPEAAAALPGRRPALTEGQQLDSSGVPSVQPARQRPKTTPVAPVEVDDGKHHVYLERKQLLGLLPAEIVVDSLTESEIKAYKRDGYKERPDKLQRHEEEYESMRGEQFL